MSKYQLKASQIESEVLSYHNSTDGWTSQKTISGMSVSYKKSPHFAGTLYRFTCDVEAPDDAVYKVMKPPLTTAERLSWDKSIKHFECFENISEDLMIGLILTHSACAGMISSREFLDLYYFKPHVPSLENDFDRISWIFAESIDVPARPATSKYVRAHNYPTGYAVCRYRHDQNKCKLVLYINIDIGGMIPKYLVEKALPAQQASYIESVKQQVSRMLNS